MKYLQLVLKKFDSIAVFTNNLLIQYFQNSLNPSIYTQLDEINHDLDNWQVLVKQAMDAKAKTD